MIKKKIRRLVLIAITIIVSSVFSGCSTQNKVYTKGTEELAEQIYDFGVNHETYNGNSLIFVSLLKGEEDYLILFTYSSVPRYSNDTTKGVLSSIGHTVARYYTITKKGFTEDDFISDSDGDYNFMNAEVNSSWYLNDLRKEHIEELMDLSEYVITDGKSAQSSKN